jgi:hypothetical protein
MVAAVLLVGAVRLVWYGFVRALRDALSIKKKNITYWETRNFSYVAVTVSNLAVFVFIAYECV